ncbi:hypothetical protein F441_14257 [Phytophthora nicotianae CJ01A1]|uniref:Integrase catalytic domain-containing protein n=1 Tax=Phytophthora nicotianae CJ01A1 TaxID=1317063 RepID=W2WIR4_PHYNI|nr:hypothetical protein F441_14257 [Phytophthora nicotianae CJ01A1]
MDCRRSRIEVPARPNCERGGVPGPVVRVRSTLRLGSGTPDHLRRLQLGDPADARRVRVRRRALDRLRMWPAHEFLHVKRDWNQSADRTDRIQRAQDEEKWVVNLNAYLSGDFGELDGGEARAVGKIAGDYDVDESGLLFYSTHAGRDDGDRDRLAKLVEPEDLQQDVLHHYHTSLEGGSEELTSGSGRTFTGAVCLRVYDDTWDIARIVKPGRDAQLYEESRRKRNTELLFWVDLFSGYVMAKASASRTAQTIAESYEECVFPDLEQAKPSGTIVSHDSCLIFSAPSTA